MFDDIINKYANMFNVPVSWITAFIQQESSGNPNAYRYESRINDASYGLMQLLLSTARGLGFSGTPDQLYDPDTNIFYGTKLLAQLQSRFGNDISAIASAYNSGGGSNYTTNPKVANYVNSILAKVSSIESAIVSTVSDYPVETGGSLVLVVLVMLLIMKGKR